MASVLGMLCSAKELAVDADTSGLMELPAEAPVGAPLAKILGLPDAAIEIKLTPNRPDCLSVHGLARDAAAVFSAPLALPAIDPVTAATTHERSIELHADADCPRYCGRLIEGIDAGAKTPFWLAERLRRSGIRPISLLVDVTQYVMIEIGQPMHAFDADKLSGTIGVRRARAGETLKLLDDSEVTLDPDFLLITDGGDPGQGRPIALGGVMGGYATRVTESTTNVFFEAAHFAPTAISGRARKLGMHTDASHRFERGVDPELPRIAIERATRLVIDVAGGKPGPVCEAMLPALLPKRDAVALRRARVRRLLGIGVADAEVERILGALGMRVEATDKGWRATPPSARFDISVEEDLIEEIARVHGYEMIPTADAGRRDSYRCTERDARRRRHAAPPARRAQLSRGCDVCLPRRRGTRSAGRSMQVEIHLANPLAADLGVMRTSRRPAQGQPSPSAGARAPVRNRARIPLRCGQDAG